MLNGEECNIPFLKLEGVDPVSIKVFQAFFKTMRLHSQLIFNKTLENGIYPGQAVSLWFIHQQPGISQRDLAKKMHVAPPTVTNMLQKLEKIGFIERKIDERDQRLIHIYLKEQGINMLNKLKITFAEIVNISLQGLDQKQQNDLVQMLEKISLNIMKEL